MRTYPAVIQKYWYAIDWEVADLWALDLPVRTLPMADLEWHLDVPVWPDGSGKYRVTPRQVLDNPGGHKGEHDRIIAANTEYPLDVFSTGDKMMILDGIHRLAKIWDRGSRQVKVRFVPESAVTRLR